MKILFSALLVGGALWLAVPQAQAQKLQPRRTATPKPRMKAVGTTLKDGLSMKDGKIISTELGSTFPVTADKKLVNGTTVTPSGLVTRADGTTSQMVEGDYVSLTGRITTKREMMDADSVRKMMDYDIKHPGKRKEMEKAREKAEKAKEKLDKEKEKMKAKANK